MATVTGYTAERMKEIEDTTVIDGTISADDLILITREGTQINAGNVRGPQGVPGPAGDADAVNLATPVGTVVMFGGSAAPQGWLLCDGTSYVQANYPALFTAIGTSFGSVDTTHFNVPDLQQRMPVGKSGNPGFDTVGGVGGSKDLIVVDHAHPHGHVLSSAGQHKHLFFGLDSAFLVQFIGMNHKLVDVAAGSGGVTNANMDEAGAHTHQVSQDSTPAGQSGVGKNVPPYVVMNFIIRF
jgi:microcystin-dependent protein